MPSIESLGPRTEQTEQSAPTKTDKHTHHFEPRRLQPSGALSFLVVTTRRCMISVATCGHWRRCTSAGRNWITSRIAEIHGPITNAGSNSVRRFDLHEITRHEFQNAQRGILITVAKYALRSGLKREQNNHIWPAGFQPHNRTAREAETANRLHNIFHLTTPHALSCCTA